MSNYTDSDKEMHREMDKEYAIKYLDYNKLVEEYCNYQELKRETEFYSRNKTALRSGFIFTPLTCFAASCLCLNFYKNGFSLLQFIFYTLIPALTACCSIGIIKWIILSFLPDFNKKQVPFFIYVFIAIAIPIICYYII